MHISLPQGSRGKTQRVDSRKILSRMTLSLIRSSLSMHARCRIAHVPCIRTLAHVNRLYSTSKSTSAALNQEKQCQFCKAANVLPAHICSSCASPSPIPDSVSFYSFFPKLSAPPNGPFELDARDLRREFLRMQQKVHPDNFSTDDKKRLVAESTSSILNKAYTTLQQPLARAEYILSLNGIEMSEEGEKLTDADVLMTVMEAREQIEEAQSEEDLEQVKAESRQLIDAELKTLAELLGKSQWQDAKTSAIRLRYWLNIQKAAADWEPGSEVVLEH